MEWVQREGVTGTSDGYTGIVTYDSILGGTSFVKRGLARYESSSASPSQSLK